MNEAPDAEREPDGYLRLPWPIVAAGLFVVLAALLAFGMFANRSLRPQVGIVSTPSPVAVAASTAPPVAATATLQQSGATTAPTALLSETDRATPPASTATAVPSNVAVAVPTVTPLPTVQPELADEV